MPDRITWAAPWTRPLLHSYKVPLASIPDLQGAIGEHPRPRSERACRRGICGRPWERASSRSLKKALALTARPECAKRGREEETFPSLGIILSPARARPAGGHLARALAIRPWM